MSEEIMDCEALGKKVADLRVGEFTDLVSSNLENGNLEATNHPDGKALTATLKDGDLEYKYDATDGMLRRLRIGL